MIHAPAFGVTTAAILGRRHVCRLTPAGVRRSAAGPACWPAQRSGSRRWGLSLVSGRSPQSPCITATRHARAMAHPHRREPPQTNGGANGCTTWHPNVTCRRRFDSCVLPIDQGASSAGRSAVAEPGDGIPPAPPAPERIAVGQLIVLKRSQRAERRFHVALCLTGRAGQGVPLMAGGAALNHRARCQPESHRHASRLLAPCCSQAP
jgi:hypothetical protein